MAIEEPLARPQQKRIDKFVYATVAIVVVLGVTVVVSGPQRLQPGEVIDELGEYRFPSGNRKLSITKDESGNVRVAVHRQKFPYYCGPYGYSPTGRPRLFESERDWFLSVDKYNRLWGYLGHWDPAWGTLRQMPSGGTIPYAPAVFLDGMFFTSSGDLVSGLSVVTSTGTWAGVPEQFFNRIPDRESAQWGTVPPIPTERPQLSRQEKERLTKLLNRAK